MAKKSKKTSTSTRETVVIDIAAGKQLVRFQFTTEPGDRAPLDRALEGLAEVYTKLLSSPKRGIAVLAPMVAEIEGLEEGKADAVDKAKVAIRMNPTSGSTHFFVRQGEQGFVRTEQFWGGPKPKLIERTARVNESLAEAGLDI